MSNATVLRIGCVLAGVLVWLVAATATAQQVYVPPVAGVHAYGYVAYPYGYYNYNPRRAYRLSVRYGYVPAPAVVVRGPSDYLASPYHRYPYYGPLYYGYPYYGYLRAPIASGSGIAPYGPTYRSGYGPPAPGPYTAGPSSPSGVPAPPPPAAAPTPAPMPAPEPIPAPPSEVGPREF
jgi:hypothetical protein